LYRKLKGSDTRLS